MEQSFIHRQIDDFVIQEHIGYSALSTLFRATQVSLKRDVTLKILGLDELPLERAEFLRVFMEQAGIVTQIEHMHILPIYAYGVVEDELAYIANRLMSRKLSELLHERSPSFEKCAQMIRQVASGLDYACSKGVLHGSIATGNIYLDYHENAFIDDYEMSRVAQAARTHEQLLRILGTPVYASPEQLRLELITFRSDIYSLGAIVYRMMTGREPFEMPSGSIPELIQMHQQHVLVPPRNLNPGITSAAEAVILKAMHENPQERFETATALAGAFEQAAAHNAPVQVLTRLAPQPIPAPESGEQERHSRVWIVLVVSLLIVAMLFALLMLSRG